MIAKPDAAKLIAFCRYAPPTSHDKTQKAPKAQRFPQTRWLAKRPIAIGIAMPTAARRPSAKASSFMSVPEYKGSKARQAFCHLDPGIRPEFSTLRGFAARSNIWMVSSGLFLSAPTISRETLRSPLVGAHNADFQERSDQKSSRLREEYSASRSRA